MHACMSWPHTVEFKPCSTASTLDELSVSLEGATQPCSYVSRRWVGVVAILPHGRRGAMAAWGGTRARGISRPFEG
jgi:hypothetical protein